MSNPQHQHQPQPYLSPSTELKALDKDDEARIGETAVDGEGEMGGLVDTADYQEFVRLERVFVDDNLKKLTRKVDLHVLPQLILIYLMSYIDRTNIGNARLFGAESDMSLSGKDWNLGLTVFFITYALAGPPSNIALKRFGPRLVLPTLLLCVSLILIGSGCASNKAQWIALRLLLGTFEAGIFPGCAFVLSTWYTPADIHSRMTIFYVGASGAGAFSGLLAYGIGQLDGTWGYRGWRFIYIIEGIVSLLLALVSYFWIQNRPAEQGKWLAADEQRFLVLRNRFMYGAARAGTGSKDEFNWRAIAQALKSWQVHVMSIMFFTVCIAVYGLSFTLPTIMANMGFSAANAQALSAPPYIFACICVLASGWYSDKYRKRMWAEVIPSIVGFVGLLICVLTVTHKNLIPLTYIGVSLAAGGLYCLSPCIAVWIGLNTAGQTKRAAAISITVVAAQLGGLAGSNIFIASEKPGYPTGFGTSLAVLGFGNILVPFVYYWVVGRINQKREAMDEDAITQKYTQEELADMGDLSPFYRYER